MIYTTIEDTVLEQTIEKLIFRAGFIIPLHNYNHDLFLPMGIGQLLTQYPRLARPLQPDHLNNRGSNVSNYK